MIALGDEEALYSLVFIDQNIEKKFCCTITLGRTKPLDSIEEELGQYFQGKLREFKTPVKLIGSPFQMSVWEELRKIPYGKTVSYAHLAAAIDRPAAYRAAARANGANPLPLIIPCHRVIYANGALGGYSSGLARKQWLIDHEQ
jgi:AraC family transcriptional regulator of adaptative response/methylated-DNA-[protein]-cysteine methyltransferase